MRTGWGTLGHTAGPGDDRVAASARTCGAGGAHAPARRVSGKHPLGTQTQTRMAKGGPEVSPKVVRPQRACRLCPPQAPVCPHFADLGTGADRVQSLVRGH